MEIPTDKIDNELDNLADTLLGDVSQPATRIKTVLDAREVIKAQALEIVELQAVIVRLREERVAAMIDGDIELGHGTDFWAKRRMTAWKALPEPRTSWEDFKRTWKDS